MSEVTEVVGSRKPREVYTLVTEMLGLKTESKTQMFLYVLGCLEDVSCKKWLNYKQLFLNAGADEQFNNFIVISLSLKIKELK